MSWIQKLYDTYNNCLPMIGMESDKKEVPLLPICHSTQMAHVEVVLDAKGNFIRACVISKSEARTIIPCTEGSAGRSGSKPECHPLCDKLQYVAGDFKKYGGTVTSGFSKDPDEPYRNLIEILTKWCESEFSHPKAKAVLEYIKKKDVIRDLVEYRILFVGIDGKLLAKDQVQREKNAPDIFSVIDSQEDIFIRWKVEIPGDPEAKVWRDRSFWESWINYYKSTKHEKSLCYVTGEKDFLADQHPGKLRNDADKAKLISSNDSSGFTFRGRFLTSEQAAAVGFETSQKAHSALRWLISRQGYRKGDLAIVAWATSGAPVPKPLDDLVSLLDLDELPADQPSTLSTAQEVAIRLKKKIAGYGKELGDTTDVVVMGLYSATPGRMAIIFYRELTGSIYLQRVNDWHESCAWIHTYNSIAVQDPGGNKVKRRIIPFIGAPAPADIAEAAYGSRIDDKLRKITIERLLPCIIDGQPIPRDLVEASIRRACNRVAMESWEWNKTLSIACALYRKYNRKENFNMSLDPDRKTRDYLYGRLLALAESLEEWALSTAHENRETNAARLMQRFAERPFSTWRTIELALVPYKARLGAKSKKRQRMIDEVIASFQNSDFLNDKRLTGEFLLGYHCQREQLRSDSMTVKEVDEETH